MSRKLKPLSNEARANLRRYGSPSKYIPDKEAIDRGCLLAQEKWDEAERRKRAGCREPYRIPVVVEWGDPEPPELAEWWR